VVSFGDSKILAIKELKIGKKCLLVILVYLSKSLTSTFSVHACIYGILENLHLLSIIFYSFFKFQGHVFLICVLVVVEDFTG